MSGKITVDLNDRSYDIHVGANLLEKLDGLCKDIELGLACMIVSDSNVDPIYGRICEEALMKEGYSVGRAVIPAGETSKSKEKLFKLYDSAIDLGLDRKAFVLALGGGVVGDLAGFVAASYLRGIDLVQVPTSLLAMVDSAVGGKTAINLARGKNLIGAFHQPSLVIADIETLKTLPKREYVAGLAEVVKYGVIWDAELFKLLEDNVQKILDCDPVLVERIIVRSCEIKAEVVAEDEREGGLRAILNFGHTSGHAIEQAAGYGKYLHGEALAAGMHYAARLSVREQGFTEADCERLVNLLKAFELPIRAPEFEWNDIQAAIAVDKKVVNRTPMWVLADAMGKVTHGCRISEDVLTEVWNGCCQ